MTFEETRIVTKRLHERPPIKRARAGFAISPHQQGRPSLWLGLTKPEAELVRPLPAGSLDVAAVS